MTRPFARLPRNATSALLAVAMSVASAVFAVGPAGASIAQAQSCNPQIGIDSPAPGDTVNTSATFTGWAVDLSSPAGSGVDSVRLYRDAPPEQGGVGLAVATVGIDRPDVDAANGLTSSGAGWSADVDFSDVPSGSYTVYIYAHTLCGWTYATQDVAVVSSNAAAAPPASGSLQISLDSPAQGALLNNGQTVSITGWAVDPSASGTGVDAVRLFLDGQEGTGTPIGFAQYGKARADVASMSGNPDWNRSGFDMSWNINGVAAGSHTLYIYAHSLASGGWDYTTLPISVTGAGAGSTVAQNAAAGVTSANAVVKIESPSSGSGLNGSTILRGYALDCASGTPASTVRVYGGTNTSGRLLGTATVGAGTRDLTSICASSGMSGQANVGFTFSVDPSALAGGPQAITVAADTVSGPATATVTFGGGPGNNPNASASGSSSNCNSNPSSAAYSPFTVSCAPGTGSVPNQQAQMQAQLSGQGAQNQPAATSSSYNCGPTFQNGTPGQNQNYMAAANGYAAGTGGAGCTSANSSMYNNSGYNSTGTSYNPSSPYNSSSYPNNGYNSYNNGYNTAYNNNQAYNQNYNANYNPNYTNYNNTGYPYNGYNNGYNGSSYPYNNYNSSYPYNNSYGYNGYTNYNGYNGYNPTATYYSNPNPYGTSYNNGQYYGTNYNGYYGTSYNGYGSPYYGGGYNQAPPGYSPNYVYAGNAGTNYGYPGGYGYTGYTGGYGGYLSGSPGYGGYGYPTY